MANPSESQSPFSGQSDSEFIDNCEALQKLRHKALLAGSLIQSEFGSSKELPWATSQSPFSGQSDSEPSTPRSFSKQPFAKGVAKNFVV